MAGRHARDDLFATREWVLIPGNERNPGTWWRMPTDGTWFTPDMRYGLGLVSGRVVDLGLSLHREAAYWPPMPDGARHTAQHT